MNPRSRWALAAPLLFASVITARAFVFLGASWPTGSVPLQLQLDATGRTNVFPLTDGSRSWNGVAQSALNEWTAVGGRSGFTFSTSTATTAAYGDGASSVLFDSSPYGMDFPGRALAVTFLRPLDGDRDQIRAVEADVFVNTAYTWNSYRGVMQSPPYDLRRVLLHEFGHVLGLDHPDEHQQSVAAVMNTAAAGSTNSLLTLNSLQADDIAGYRALYNAPFAKPVFTTQPAGAILNAGGAAALRVAIDGQSPPATGPFRSTRWFFKATAASDYELLFTLHQPGDLVFNLAQPLDSGSYYYRAVTPDDTVDSDVVTLTVNPVPAAPATALANLSTRGLAGGGNSAMIVGFVIAGSRAKTVLVRAVGPTLSRAPFNIPRTVADPVLILKNSSNAVVATSAPLWESSTNITDIRAATSRVGAFALTPGSHDAVLLVTLPPGNYTAQAISPDSNSGVVLVEAYDADAVRDPASRLLNLSTRGWVDAGADILIAGFVVSGPGPRTYLIRAVGDTLKNFGVTSTLDDPILRIYSSNGTLLRELDDWDSPGAVQPALRAAFEKVGAFGLTDRQESAMLLTLPPGNYTAQVSGYVTNGVAGTGIALIELYEIP